MFREYQAFIQQLTTLTFTIATSQTPQTINLRDLLKKLYNETEIANLIGFVLECQLTPTFTAAPTVIGLNNVLSNIQFYDGADMLFDGQGNDLRLFESLENGKTVLGEAQTQTSTNPRFWSRFLPVGPMSMLGSPSDYMIPCAELAEGGTLKITPSVLTSISVDTTAATLVVRVGAMLAGSKNQLRIGPKYQRLVKPNTGTGMVVGDEALYAYVGAVNASYAAFGAAAFGKTTLRTTKRGRYVDGVDAQLLTRVFNSQMRPGSTDQILGDQRDATFDVAPRIVNFASPTALAAQAGELQPFLWAPRGCRLSKLQGRIDPSDALTIEWAGSQGASGSFLMGRFLPHSGDSVAKRVKKAAGVLGLSSGVPQAKALDKRQVKSSAQAVKYGVYYAKAA